MFNKIASFFEILGKAKTTIEIATASNEEKKIIKLIKFLSVIGGYIGIEFFQNLMPEDLLLIAEILNKYIYIKWILYGILFSYFIKQILKIDILDIITKLILYSPKILWFIFFDIIFGIIETIWLKNKTYKDFFRETFAPFYLAFELKKSQREIFNLQKKINELNKKILVEKNREKKNAIKKEITEARKTIDAHRDYQILLSSKKS